MNLKTKAIGLLAGSALALSLASGAVAQDIPLTATVEEGTCTVSGLTSSGSFGTWQYQGTGYARTAGNNVVSLTGNYNSGSPLGCDVTITFAGLSDGTNTIAIQNFSVDFPGVHTGSLSGFTGTSITGTREGVPSGPYSGSITLDTIPATTPATGIYEGDVTVTVTTQTQ